MNNVSMEAGNKPEAGSLTDFQESSYRYVKEGHVQFLNCVYKQTFM